MPRFGSAVGLLKQRVEKEMHSKNPGLDFPGFFEPVRQWRWRLAASFRLK